MTIEMKPIKCILSEYVSLVTKVELKTSLPESSTKNNTATCMPWG